MTNTKDSRTTVSLSLQKCLVSNEYLKPITDMVEAITWASANMMWMVNLVVLKHIERGLDPPPLCRDLFMDCYTHSCKPKPKNTQNKIQAETDYYRLAVDGIKRKRFHDMPCNQHVNKRRKISLYPPEEASVIEGITLSPKSIKAAWNTGYKNDVDREEKFQSKESWHAILKEITAELDSLSHTTSWRPHPSQLNGESDHMDQLVKSELLPNSKTYISETYKARRRFYFVTQLKPFFSKECHASRVTTELLRILDGVKGASIVNGSVDWNPVFRRVRTKALKESFQKELDVAVNDKDFNQFCMNLLQQFPQTPSATTQNLKDKPHKFLRALHFMQRDREEHNHEQISVWETGDDDEDSTEDDQAKEDFQDIGDRRSLQKQFTLLPLKSGCASFIYLDLKRVEGMKRDIPIGDGALGLKWYECFLDPTKGIRNKAKQSLIISNQFRTDGVQLKVFISRSEGPVDHLTKRGYHHLSDMPDSTIDTNNGVCLLEKITQVDGHHREIIGLDPGVKEIYTSVDSNGVSQSVSNRQWAHMQRTKLIRRKNARWKDTVGGLTTVLDGMSSKHTKTSSYSGFMEAVKYRLSNRHTLWKYQMRRNRQVYRFSSLLARRSAIDRLGDAVVNHQTVRRRCPRRRRTTRRPTVNKRDLAPPVLPIVAFGGGQFRSGGNGLMSVPRKDLVKSIARRSLAAITDEHKSTQTCSCCGSRLCDPDLRLLDADGIPQGGHREFNKKQKTRLRRCKSEACSVPMCIQSNDGVSNLQLVRQKHWNRDVNAAVNIRKTAEEWLRSHSRPVHLRRTMADICVNQHEQPARGITLAIKEKNP